MFRVLRTLALLVFLATLAGGAALLLLTQEYAGFNSAVFVDVPRGTGTRQIARMLRDAGVVRHEGLFLLARAVRPNALLLAGEYRFARPGSVLDVFERIARGDIFYYQLLVAEGNNMFDIAAAVDKLGIVSAADFLAAARDPFLIRDLAPDAPSLEGYLFPDTYRFPRNTGARQMCQVMVARFRKEWKALGAPENVHHMVTLASLVEEETAVPEERPAVSSVFQNRLKLGMKLDCDPSTVYAALLEGRYRGTLHRSDLLNAHPYNTYRNPGLPPGPIANPGMQSLRAALDPADTEYLYFVAVPDGAGRHVFSRDLSTHSAAAAKYRRARQGK
ncbi:MAG: endolytic transglycosylase MltG [Bryobacteraceae bacterium]